MDSKLLALVALMLSEIDTITVSLEDDHDVDVWENKFALLLAAYLLSAYMLVKTGEVSDLETNSLQRITDEQLSYLAGFADEIRANIKDGWDEAWEARARSYSNALGAAYQLAAIVNRGLDALGRWDRSKEKMSCPDCIELDGQVHPMSWYIDNNHIPRGLGQRCGDNCGCDIVPV